MQKGKREQHPDPTVALPSFALYRICLRDRECARATSYFRPFGLGAVVRLSTVAIPHPTTFRNSKLGAAAKPHHLLLSCNLQTTSARERGEETEMENRVDGGGARTKIQFGFSWADEVEREEQEQVAMQQQQPPRIEEKKREQIKPDPFGAARPREVVLAEKGVDWRARDLELELSAAAAAPRPPRNAARVHRHAASTAEAASGRATGGISASACAETPARGVPLDRDAGSGRAPHPRRQAAAAASTPRQPTGRMNATSVSRSARGGGKRKFAGEGPVRRARPAGDNAEQGRRVFGELNVGNGCGSSFCASAVGNCGDNDQGGVQTKGMKAAAMAAAADGVPSTAVTATGFDGSAAGQKRRRGKGRNGRGSGKTKKQQTQLL
ncbi:hypothetical protein HU200_021388 [Digitaria exilis]|uniref:Uncharacterized protein n=1 Tax=Digitaria exilis TaxID=1010633 RepID=A0A835F0A1_9POAL|nr:hypothetical protein HU200_021388 [Digitaria exilis]